VVDRIVEEAVNGNYTLIIIGSTGAAGLVQILFRHGRRRDR
jgi:hypothetical protein